MGIRIFNRLPFDIKAFTNIVKQFKTALIVFFIHSIHYWNILT